ISAWLSCLSELCGRPSDVRTLTCAALTNIIGSVIVGKRFEYDDEYFTKFVDMLDEQFRLSTSSSLFSLFPWLRYLPGDLFKAKRRTQNHRSLTEFFCNYYIEQTEQEYDEKNLDNFVAAYLSEMKKMARQGKDTTLDKENLRRDLLQLFLAGSDTTASTILWFMIYMLYYPMAQEKSFKEIENVVGTERTPTMHDKTKMKFTHAAILETQRLATIGPLGVPHFCNKDTVIKGYTIPAGTTVLSNLDAVLLSDKTWDQPLEFRPDRFLYNDGNLIHPEEFIPFSIGLVSF
ncbi:hypothetical protein RRG08_061398, partial [Elysia crispata]